VTTDNPTAQISHFNKKENAMRLKLKIILCLALLIGYASSFQAQETKKEGAKKSNNISSKYNKSKNLTTVSLKKMALTGLQEEKPQAQEIPTHQMDMEIFFTHPGEQMEKPVEQVTLRFMVATRAYFFMRPQPISVILDEKIEGAGKLLRLGDSDYKSDLKFNSIYEEFMTIQIPAETLSRIAEAKTVSIYVGPSAYSLREKQIADLREMASRTKP
jgi:hypothetical protein